MTLHAIARNLLREEAVRSIVVRALDVTEGKALERALKESNAKFRCLVEQAISGIYIIQDEKFVYVNPRFSELFGYSASELIGAPFPQLVAEADRATVTSNIRRRLEKQVKTLRYSFNGLRKDGSTFIVGVQGTFAEYEGKPAVIGILQDITDRVAAEKREQQYAAQLENALLGTVNAVSNMLLYRDPYTAGHEKRVGHLSASIATTMGLAPQAVKALELIGSIHDVGKIAVPAEILAKPAKLSLAEFELVKEHSKVGHDLLQEVKFPWPVAKTILEHHERLDGSGYPRGLQGEAISLTARIVAVADVVEAMASHRPYRPALGIDAALSEIERGKGTLYDAQATAACMDLFLNKKYQFITR